MDAQAARTLSDRLSELLAYLQHRGEQLALFLVYDRPSLVEERPGLALTYFAERCESDDQLEAIMTSFREIGAYVELFEGERPFALGLSSGRLQSIDRPIKIAYNGIGWGIGPDGFKSGRKAVVPLLADSFKILCANSDPYACVLTRHKFHCFTILRHLGVSTPRCWFYELDRGWCGEFPEHGTHIIVKSTYEAWSVGVTEDSAFVAGDDLNDRVSAIAQSIGQDVTVQEFITGPEVYVPMLRSPDLQPLPPVRSLLGRAPDDVSAVVTIQDNLMPDSIRYELFTPEPEIAANLTEQAIKIAEVLDLKGLSRIDFRVDDNGVPWVFDIGISPGLERGGSSHTSISSLGFSYAEFLRIVLASSLVSPSGTQSAPPFNFR